MIGDKCGFAELLADAFVIVKHIQVAAARGAYVFDIACAMFAAAFNALEACEMIYHELKTSGNSIKCCASPCTAIQLFDVDSHSV